MTISACPSLLRRCNGKVCLFRALFPALTLTQDTVPVYLIFMCWDLFEVIVIYFFVVETKGFTLEEIGEIFGQPNPRKFSDELLRNARQNRGA